MAQKLQLQIDGSGAVDPDAARVFSEANASPVKDSACSAISGHKKAFKPDSRAEGGATMLRQFVKTQLAISIGKHPSQLYAMKLKWPPSWLKDPAVQPDYVVPVKESDAHFLSRYLKADFVATDGSAMFPTANSPDFSNFGGWLAQTGNTMADRTSYLTQSIDRSIRDCINGS